MVITQHFTPEVTAARFRLEAFVDGIGSRGHEADVVCAVPNHPRGVVEPGYRRKLRVHRRQGSAEVTHVWLLASPRKTFSTRIAAYGSFAAAAVAAGAARPRPDVVLASSPPLPVGAAGLAVARRHRAPWVLDVRDVWPDSAVKLGELENRHAIALAERLERGLYRRADAVVTVNEAFAGHVAQRTGDPGKVHLVPNGTTRRWLAIGDEEPDRSVLGEPEEDFVWVYAGNLGLAHQLESAVEAAAMLGDGFRLLLIGDGPRREELAAGAAALPAGRVELLGLMEPSEAARRVRAADALLVSESQEQTVASKLYDYCAAGRPVVAACRGEMHRVIERTRVGLAVPHGDAGAIADAVRRLQEDPELGAELGARGRRLARDHLREVQADRLVDLLEEVAAP